MKTIKEAILRSQYDAAKAVNEKQLTLYFFIGNYISDNVKKGKWGDGAINIISERLDKELPGLRGFSTRNLHYMKKFYEEWSFIFGGKVLDYQSLVTASEIVHPWVPNLSKFINELITIRFKHRRIIMEKS